MSSKQKQAFKSAPGEKQANQIQCLRDGKNYIEKKIIKKTNEIFSTER